MTELIERYVHQVGRYVPSKDRLEIETELRSLIQDQLDDRYGGSPTDAEVTSVLIELGSPHQMAASYRTEQYLIGPDLYPYMMMGLRRGWLYIPAIVIFLNIFRALVSSQSETFINVMAAMLFTVIGATFLFTSAVVLMFALIQHFNIMFDANTFDPKNLPAVDDPRTIDRYEITFGVGFGLFVSVLLLYFISVGGLTLADPDNVLPVSTQWLFLMLMTGCIMMVIQLIVLRRNRWHIRILSIQIVLELFGVICLYFAVTKPIVDELQVDLPLAEIFAIGYAVVLLINKGSQWVSLWSYE